MMRTHTQGLVVHRAEVTNGQDYHFLVLRDGTVRDLVPFQDVGQHALTWNRSTVAIAVFGDFAASEPGKNSTPTEAQLVACERLVGALAWWYGKGNLWLDGHSALGPTATAFPEKLAYGHTCPGERFPLERFKTLPGLIPR